MRSWLQPSRRFPLLYLKELPFHLNEKAKQRVRILGEFLGIVLLTAFTVYLLLNNFAPLGVTAHYNLSDNNDGVSTLGPKERVSTDDQAGDITYHQLSDLIYFTTKMPFIFDKASVKIMFKNSDPTQKISLGFQDQEIYHYATKPLDVPFLNNLSWSKNGKNPILYQREKHYASVDEFLTNPPKELLIGTYEYEPGFGRVVDPQLTNYQPATEDTIINSPLRGTHMMYVYLKNEPFRMTIEKQDLNWYEDPDPVTIKVYKDQALVYQVNAADDGIIDNSKKTLPPQIIEIKNPGPDLPENGLYRVVIDANDDTIIKRITTNLHKIVFAGTIFPTANQNAYSPVISNTYATTMYTNALLLSGLTYHNSGLQKIEVGNQMLDLDTVKLTETISPPDILTKVVIPKNDVILNGFQGYFAFQENQFFLPTPYRIVPIKQKADIEIVDYILSSYQPSTTDGDWQVQELTFDIRSAFIKNGRLSWIITAPGLKENNREIIIKDIEVTLHKKPWL